MDRPNLGFALFLVLLLIAPGIPVPGFAANVSMSTAAVGLLIWFILAPRLPLRVVLEMPTVLALIGFSLYVLLISFASGRLVSIAYGLQYAFYVVLTGMLIPGYLVHKMRQGRQADAWRIVAWVGAIYLAGIIVSLWTGPIYPHQVGMFVKHYGTIDIVRGVGFAESANLAGGIAAVLAAFYLVLYRPSGRRSLALAVVGLLGLIATLSRSAIGAFLIAICVLVALSALRTLVVRGMVRVRRLPMVPAALVMVALVATMVGMHQPIIATAWDRLLLDEEVRDQDVSQRLDHWQSGMRAWADKRWTHQIFGSGFRSSGVSERRGVYISSHNAYIEMLNDFGLLGVIIFISTLTAGLLRALYLVLTHRNCTLAAFCVVGLTAMAVHNATQVFFYSTATMVMLILLLTCGELAAREQRLVLRGIRSSSTAQRACASRGGALQEPRFHQTSRSRSRRFWRAATSSR